MMGGREADRQTLLLLPLFLVAFIVAAFDRRSLLGLFRAAIERVDG